MDEVEQQRQVQNIRDHLGNFVTNRKRLGDFLLSAAVELDEHHKNVTITKVVTGSTGIAGTIISLLGIGLAPITGGLSLPLTVGGGVLGAISGAAHLGSSFVEHILNQYYMDKLEELSHLDEENYWRLDNHLQRYVAKLRTNAFDNAISIRIDVDIFNQLSTLANVGCSIIRVTRITSTGARSIRVLSGASVVLGVVTLPLQIIHLAVDGQALYRNQRSEKAQKFRQLADDLRIQVNNVTLLVARIIGEHEQQHQQQPNYQNNQPHITFNPITVIFVPIFIIIIFFIIAKIFQLTNSIITIILP